MILQKGNMWSAFPNSDCFLITTNSFIKRNRSAVLGRGIALEATKRFPELPHLAGQAMSTRTSHLGEYGVIGRVCGNIGIFQVKHHWGEPAKLDLIKRSCDHLIRKLDTVTSSFRVDLNFPGIGNGKLAYNDVLPIVSQLPDNVNVWTF